MKGIAFQIASKSLLPLLRGCQPGCHADWDGSCNSGLSTLHSLLNLINALACRYNMYVHRPGAMTMRVYFTKRWAAAGVGSGMLDGRERAATAWMWGDRSAATMALHCMSKTFRTRLPSKQTACALQHGD